MIEKKLLKVEPTDAWIKEDILIAIGVLIDAEESWTLNIETGELTNPFGRVITNNGNQLLKLKWIAEVTSKKREY